MEVKYDKCKKQKEIIWIDALKGLAICGVVMVHSEGMGFPKEIAKIASFGQYGVQLFFMISAYLAMYSLSNFYESRNEIKLKTVFIWWKKKFINLIPLYWLALIVYIVLTGGQPYWLGEEGKITLYNAMFHFLFLHGSVPRYINSIIGGEWYLANLAIMYIVIPYIYKFIDRFEKAVGLFLGSLFVCNSINIYLVENYIPQVSDSYIFEAYYGHFSFLQQFPVIVLGILLYFIIEHMGKRQPQTESGKVFSYELIIICILLVVGEIQGDIFLKQANIFVRISLWFYILIISQNLYQSKVVCNPILCLFGKYSYGIYLFHVLYIRIWDSYVNIDGNNIFGWVLKYFVILGVALFSAIVIERIYNKPAKNIILNKKIKI